MHKGFLRLAAILGALTVALGAFGAHGLRQYVTADAINTFETGVRYQFYHVFALLITGILHKRFPVGWTRAAGYFFVTGIILFSGSLYALTALEAAQRTGLRSIGVITPLGGIFLILGWISLFFGVSSSVKVASRSSGSSSKQQQQS